MTRNNRNSANTQLWFADDTIMSFTLRELQSVFTSSRFWIGFSAVALILTVTGPFGTINQFNMAERIVYWVVTSLITFPIGIVTSLSMGIVLYRSTGLEWFARIVSGIIAGLPIASVVWVINSYLFGLDMGGWSVFLRVWGYTTAVSVAVTVLYYLVSLEMREHGAHGPAIGEPKPTHHIAFNKRIPVALGKDLVSISTQDHYLEVVTPKGRELILMRFSDALDELSNAQGLQIHRSHWVATKHITGSRRTNGQLYLIVSNGNALPVSRTYAKSVRLLLEERLETEPSLSQS